jgi:hypothetical protein
VDAHDDRDHDVRDQRRDRHVERDHRALADADDVDDAEQHQAEPRRQLDMMLEEGDHGPDVLERADRGNRRRQEVVDDDEHAAHRADERVERLRGDGDDAAAFGIAPRDFDVLGGKEDEPDRGERDERRGEVADLVIQDSGNVVDARPDVAKDHRPGEQPPELAQIVFAGLRRTQALLRTTWGKGKGSPAGGPLGARRAAA